MTDLRIWCAAMALAFGLTACDRPTEAEVRSALHAQSAQNLVRPGLGDDPGLPEVDAFVLPKGVRVAGTIRGADDVTAECAQPSPPAKGSGAYVRICVPLENLTGSPVQVEFPPGLIVVSTSEARGQNGLLIERILLTVPPTTRGGGGCRRDEADATPAANGAEDEKCTYTVRLNLYCLNEALDPSNPFITYALHGVTRDPGLQEVLRLLRNKVIETDEQHGAVQHALYSVTERRGLTAEDRADFARLLGRGRRPS